MNVRGYPTAASFLDRTGDWLGKFEAENSLILGLSTRRAAREGQHPVPVPEPAWLFVTVHDRLDRSPDAAAMMTPGHPLLLAGGDRFEPACSPLVEWLLAGSWRLPGVLGREDLAALFAKRWCRETGWQASQVRRERIHQLGNTNLLVPKDVPGSLRRASNSGRKDGRADDRSIVVDWMRQFHDEAAPKDPRPDVERLATRHLHEGSFFLWDVGRPVSMAVHVRSARSTASINGVFTPPADRGNGYASACVAALCRRLLKEDFTNCVLYTDLANQTSNRIYRRIGFSSVCDVLHLALAPAGA